MENLTLLQTIDNPTGIDPAHFGVKLNLSTHQCDFMSKLTKKDFASAKTSHRTFQFVDDHCTLNDGEKFQKSYKKIYLKELALKSNHFGSHATFLGLDITISKFKTFTLCDKHVP